MAGARPDATVHVVSLQRCAQLPHLRPQSLAGPRPRHPPRHARERRRARPRPRLPAPTHRARPARRHADKMGHPTGRAMKHEHDTNPVVFWCCSGRRRRHLPLRPPRTRRRAPRRHVAAVPPMVRRRRHRPRPHRRARRVPHSVPVIARLVPASARAPVRAGIFATAIVLAIAWAPLHALRTRDRARQLERRAARLRDRRPDRARRRLGARRRMVRRQRPTATDQTITNAA